MNKERLRILKLVSKGKITIEEAESLLEALNTSEASDKKLENAVDLKSPKFLYVKVSSTDDDNVDIKVPISLVRAGMRLTSLIPPQAMEHVNESIGKHGISIDLNNLKKEDIEVLIQSLSEMEVNVNSKDGDKVRIYCE
jgi:hypothetical protein